LSYLSYDLVHKSAVFVQIEKDYSKDNRTRLYKQKTCQNTLIVINIVDMDTYYTYTHQMDY